jgi:hypothetical protein
MAHDILSLAEMLVINGAGLADIEVSDVLNASPFVRACYAQQSSNGTVHKYLKETGAPVVGFRAVNAGRDHDVSEDEQVSLSLAILDAAFHTDKNLADEYAKGGAPGWMAREAARHLRAAFFAFEQQIFQGQTLRATGFPGLPDAAGLQYLADAMVIGAGGSEGESSDLTSVWAIRTVPDDSDVTLILGNEGEIKLSEYFMQMMDDGTGKFFPAYVQPIDGWTALQIGSAYSVGRLANIGTATNTTLNDTFMAQLYDLFPSGRPPTHFVMTRRSRGQLRTSRMSEYMPYIPTPAEWEGIPILVTDSISNTEAAVGAEAGT